MRNFLVVLLLVSLGLFVEGCRTSRENPSPIGERVAPRPSATPLVEEVGDEEEREDEKFEEEPKPSVSRPLVYQLATIRRGEDEIYRASDVLNGTDPVRVVSFLNPEDTKKAKLSVRVFEEDRYVYGVDVFFRYVLSFQGVTGEATALHEHVPGPNLFSAKKNVVMLAGSGARPADTMRTLLRWPHPRVRDFLAGDFDRKLSYAFEFPWTKLPDRLALPVNSKGEQIYLFSLADDPDFELRQRSPRVDWEDPFRTLKVSESSGAGVIRLFADEGNWWNATDKDDIFYYEPLVSVSNHGRAPTVTLSSREAYRLLTKKLEKAIPAHRTLSLLPGLYQVQLLDSARKTVLGGRVFEEGEAEGSFTLPMGEEGRAWIEYLDAAGRLILRRDVSLEATPSR